MPRTVGERPVQPAAVLALLAGLIVTGCAASAIVAYRLRYSSDLGRPWIGPIYAPWAWLTWLWAAYNPFTGVNPITHQQHYVPAFYAALRAIPWTLGIGVAASLVLYSRITVAIAPRDKEKVKTVVDSAHFASIQEIREKTTLLSANCGPVIGMVETVPRKSTCFGLVTLEPPKFEYLRSGDSQTGTNIVGITGAGKTPDYFKQLLLNRLVHPDAETWSKVERRAHPHGYEPNLVIFDLKGSLKASTSGFQAEVLGKRVFVFSPFSRDYTLSKYNPLHFIRLTEEEEFDDCYRAGLDIVDEGQGLKDYWSKVALDFGAAIVATVGYIALSRNTPSLFSHAGVIDYVSSFKTPDELIVDMLDREHDPHGVLGWRELDENGVLTDKPTKKRDWIVKAATVMHARAVEEKSGIFGSFVSYIGVYRGPILRQHISETTFDLKALANDPERASTVYIVMPDSDLEQIRPFFRIMVKDMFRRLMTGTVTIDGRELPANLRMTRFVLDEVRALNKLEPLAVSAGYMRGHKVVVDTAWQTRSQLLECYGQNETVTGNLATQMFYQTQPGPDAEWLSKKCGQTSFVLQHRNLSGKRMAPIKGQIGEQNQVQTRQNLTEYEANNLGSEQKIIFADGAIIRAHQCRYYKSKALDRRARIPQVSAADATIETAPFLAGIRKSIGPERLATLTSPAPDRWADARKAAEVLPNECRVRRWQGAHKETGAQLFYAQLWLPNAIRPVLDTVVPTIDEREKAIQAMLDLHSENEPKAPAPPVFVPHNPDPAVSFLAALATNG